ncbi:YjbE family integral membrane protein [Methylosinus sp. sav-2]|uniref:TerC family protein n=1 Tax=Methylosinus sp. sav-2 TaxID=2485168 RepID=UPI00047A5FBD|nr:TerC family protein [Methylosinus sp. sav-2]TDX67195.1 YjbE family integral membrane protein [Methylosinus sp. sav-2]
MNGDELSVGFQVLEIIWIDLLLSGDNAILIALACHKLPKQQRRWGILLGAGGGVLLRIAFAFVVIQLMAIPALKALGGLMLLGVATKLLVDETEHHMEAKEDLWGAVAAIIMADAVMSLDNVIAIAGAAEGSMPLIIFGLAVSVPIVVFGAGLLMQALSRFPILVWAGAGLLGWISGELIASDPIWEKFGWTAPAHFEFAASVAGAVLVLVAGFIAVKLEERAEARRKAEGGG